MHGLEAVTDAQADADDRRVEVRDVDVEVGEDPQLEVALGDPVHSDAWGDDEVHGSGVRDEEPGLEPDAEGNGPGGGVERRAEQGAPELWVGDVEAAEIDPVEVRIPEGGGQSGEERWAELPTLDGDHASAVSGQRESTETARPGHVTAFTDLGT